MKYRHIIFDFDGVLADSNEIRFEGFVDLFADIGDELLERFMTFVKANGGLSRYGKIRHLHNEILCRSISESEVISLAEQYSHLVMDKIIQAEPVTGSLEFLAEHGDRFDLAVISGSDQEELREVCRARGIADHFKAILGSPVEKQENIESLLASEGWDPQACVYVGDSQNDYDAAIGAGIDFIGRDSGVRDWRDLDVIWISDLLELPAALEELSRRREDGIEPQSRRSIV